MKSRKTQQIKLWAGTTSKKTAAEALEELIKRSLQAKRSKYRNKKGKAKGCTSIIDIFNDGFEPIDSFFVNNLKNGSQNAMQALKYFIRRTLILPGHHKSLYVLDYFEGFKNEIFIALKNEIKIPLSYKPVIEANLIV